MIDTFLTQPLNSVLGFANSKWVYIKSVSNKTVSKKNAFHKTITSQLLIILSLSSLSATALAQGDIPPAKSDAERLSEAAASVIDSIAGAVSEFSAVVTALIDEPEPRTYTQLREPCLNYTKTRQPFFGDVHVHTKYSLDASTQSTRTTPDEAYRFAKGERIGIQPWRDTKGQESEALRSIQLERPLDFAMVSDHAELFGETYICNTPGAEGYKSWQCKIYRNWPRGAFYLFNATASLKQAHLGFCGEDGGICKQAGSIPWDIMQQAAQDHNDVSASCEFTAFIGYEWTGVTEAAGNLHRNVLFRNHTVPELPVSWIDGSALHLWQSLESTCNGTDSGCESLTIPHNSNISGGYMFNLEHDGTNPLTRDQFALRKKYEPIVEIMQHKGASECYFEAGVSEDELCSFEFLNSNSFFGDTPPKKDDGFVRHVLTTGLLEEQTNGVNPFEFGFIGSSDTHLGTPGAVNESIFLGHGGAGVPANKTIPPGLPDYLKYNPGGLAVVWAEENSRDALFNSMQRRETYATSGPRIVNRFFGGWDYADNMCEQASFAKQGYQRGVAMGGTLTSAEDPKAAPVFVVSALQDAGTATTPGNALQRIQIIKGWVDEQGNKQEQVFDVAGDANNDASVDINSCEVSGPGYADLCTVWRDPTFDSAQPAYYYSRTLENPSCRWSQQICVANKVDCSDKSTIGKGLEGCCADEHRPVVQERAWSSPIWYKPS